jgi:hypothetical protein
MLLSHIDHLLPAIATLVTRSSGEVRVLLSSCLRRMLPYTIKALENFLQRHPTKDLSAPRDACLRKCMKATKKMLTDVAPIPQYALRLLVEVAGIAPAYETIIAIELLRCQGVDTLIQQFGGKKDDILRVSSDSQLEESVDPQIGVLLHSLFKTPGSVQINDESVTPAQYMIARGLPGSIESAFQRELYLANKIVVSLGCMSDVLGLTSVLHLLLDCLEHASISSMEISAFESSNLQICSLLSLSLELKESANLDADTALDVSQLQALGCMGLGLHLRHFVESSFRAIINQTPGSSYPRNHHDGGATDLFSLLKEMLSDQSVRYLMYHFLSLS